ncbi:putative androglobin-like [Scophthalmus maximus]|uniref:Putative androglobin-like n=1 Tax=Scophthalmus maximus TaxID=52904 RepID=A0A2U9CTX3_SCOMX|nr:putative androglobin-like [Scophthalmus maximus]
MSKAPPKKKEPSLSKASLSDRQTAAASLLASSLESFGAAWGCKFPIWPEWNDEEVNKEKWDSSKGADEGKTNKSPNAPFFEEPEGKISLPPSLNVHSWKRPTEFIVNKSPVIVESQMTFDLISANDHLICNELMRWIISDICTVSTLCNKTSTVQDGWKPWDHIYSLCRAEKGHMPLYNSYGKYLVRLYWMGSWRKITVDDCMPFDEENNLLLPASTCQTELWPMLLAKALIKVANTNELSEVCGEMGEFTFIHTLTGWIPEFRPVNSGDLGKIWDFLQDTIPIFTLPEESLPEIEPVTPVSGKGSSLKDDKSRLPEQENSKAQTVPQADKPPELLPFSATKQFLWVWPDGRKNNLNSDCVCLYDVSQANSAEVLRQYSLSLLYSHITLVTRTRSCQLEAPPQPAPVPQWKLIRPPKEIVVTAEPREPPLSKPEQFIEVASPFLSYRFKSSVGSIPELDSLFPYLCFLLRFHLSPSNCHSLSIFQYPLLSYATPPPITPLFVSMLISVAFHCISEQPPHPHPISRPSQALFSADVPLVSGGLADRHKTATKEPVTEETPVKPILEKTWMDLDDFATCFQTLLVFHNSQIYPHNSHSSNFKCPEVRGTSYLCVDSVEPSEILISFSVLLIWGETTEEKKEMSAACGSAALTAQPHSWKSVQSQLPVFTIKTTSSKAAMLNLPAGRHVLSFHTKAALGYHVHLCSRTPFVFGDEETVMPQLTKESTRFTEQASSILRALSRVVTSFSDEHDHSTTRKALEEAHCPRNINTTLEKLEHLKVFNSAVYHMLCGALDRELTAEEQFAVLALTADPSLLACGCEEDSPALDAESNLPENWKDGEPSDHEPSDQEVNADATLQAGFKGHSVQEILNAAKPGTEENLSASKILFDMWPQVESDADKHAVFLLRYIIDHHFERKAQLFPCQQDEWTNTTFVDYSVSLQDTANSWVLIFREVFLVPEEMLLAAKVYSPIPNCLLHVINNDTGEKLDMVLNKLAIHVFQPNKLGYTFVAEAVTPESPPVGAEWRMRLISSREPLPKLTREAPLNTFSVKEFCDYYIPNDDNIICRYSVQVTTDVQGTIQFQTSMQDVLIRLSILDQGKEVASNTGKGHVVIPIYFFLANKDEKNQEKSGCTSQEKGVKVEDAPQQKPGKSDLSPNQHQPPTEIMDQKYMVQAEVLYKSWELDESRLAFVQTLRDLEKKERRANELEEMKSSSTPETPSRKSDTQKNNRKGAKAKGKAAATAKAEARPETVLDLTKPHWTLRVVTDESEAESIEAEKDTERMDQITSIKKAWETVEPGRCAKALQSRLQFLNPVQPQEDAAESTKLAAPKCDADTSLSNEKLTDTSSTCPIMDYTPFIRCQKEFPVLLDTQMEEIQMRERLENIQTYRLVRDNVLEHQKQQELNRKELMRRQPGIYENMQADLWQRCKRFLEACEALSSHPGPGEKKEREEKPALEEDQKAV